MSETFRSMRLQREIHSEVLLERNHQVEKWGYEHDYQHARWEWLGLIIDYAAQGRYVEAAALCEAAEQVKRIADTVEVQP